MCSYMFILAGRTGAYCRFEHLVEEHILPIAVGDGQISRMAKTRTLLVLALQDADNYLMNANDYNN